MNEKISQFISIDPGKTVGFALWTLGRLTKCGSVDIDRINLLPHASLAIIEMPDHFRVSVDDVVVCAFRAGRISGLYPEHRTIKVNQWKGSVKKRITQARALSVLDPIEADETRGANHHCWDAIGIGLFVLGRMRR